MGITHSERMMASETEEQGEARLQRMRANQSERLAAETDEQRKARLQRVCANQSERLAAETEEQREARLQRVRANLKVRDWLPRLKNRERPGCRGFASLMVRK